MYFLIVIYYVEYTIGIISIFYFCAAVWSLFNEAAMQKEGTKAMLTLFGGYIFGSVPVALTINGGPGPDLPAWLGLTTVPVVYLFTVFSNEHQAAMAAQNKSQPLTAPRLIEATASAPRLVAPNTVPAPTTLSSDFDVPPQG